MPRIWTGGITTTKDGYFRRIRKRGGKLLHREIMEQHLGRNLSRKEIVHHIDGNPTNNDIKNLKVMTQNEHIKIHVNNKGKYKKGNTAYNRTCTRCKINFPLTREFFSPKTGDRLGFHYYCKRCRAELRKGIK